MEIQGWKYKIERHSVELSGGSSESSQSLERIEQSLERVEECLNDEGSDGWEVVSVVQADIHDDMVDLVVFYKRPAERRQPTATISSDEMNEFVDKAKDLLEKKRDGL